MPNAWPWSERASEPCVSSYASVQTDDVEVKVGPEKTSFVAHAVLQASMRVDIGQPPPSRVMRDVFRCGQREKLFFRPPIQRCATLKDWDSACQARLSDIGCVLSDPKLPNRNRYVAVALRHDVPCQLRLGMLMISTKHRLSLLRCCSFFARLVFFLRYEDVGFRESVATNDSLA